MKSSWMLYDYLRRWWRVLLILPIIGSFAGLAIYQVQSHPVLYDATAIFSVENSGFGSDDSLLRARFSVGSVGHTTQEAAIKDMTTAADAMSQGSAVSVVIEDLVVNTVPITTELWKTVIFGGLSRWAASNWCHIYLGRRQILST